MRIILGVNDTNQVAVAASWLKRLAFPAPQLTCVHGYGPVLLPSVAGDIAALPPEVITELLDAREKEAREVAERGRATAEGNGLASDSVAVDLPPADALMHIAEENQAELVAIGNTGHGAIASVLLGSVGRKLGISCTRSLLVAKQAPAADTPAGAVLATDHSDYAQRCIDHLCAMRPAGLRKITLVSAFDIMATAAGFGAGPGLAFDINPEAVKKLDALNAAAAVKLRAAGFEVDHSVAEEPVISAIRRTMDESGADLLILGAQGHGLVHRALLGSVALHFLVSEPYSLLLLRA